MVETTGCEGLKSTWTEQRRGRSMQCPCHVCDLAIVLSSSSFATFSPKPPSKSNLLRVLVALSVLPGEVPSCAPREVSSCAPRGSPQVCSQRRSPGVLPGEVSRYTHCSNHPRLRAPSRKVTGCQIYLLPPAQEPCQVMNILMALTKRVGNQASFCYMPHHLLHFMQMCSQLLCAWRPPLGAHLGSPLGA